MSFRYLFIILISLPLLSVICIGAETATKTDNPILPYITLPISVYILDDQGRTLSSTRTNEQVLRVFDKANEIWSQAGIKFEIKYIGRAVIPPGILKELVNGNYKPFLKGMNRNFQTPNPPLFNAYYASSIGLVNGITVVFCNGFPKCEA